MIKTNIIQRVLIPTVFLFYNLKTFLSFLSIIYLVLNSILLDIYPSQNYVFKFLIMYLFLWLYFYFKIMDISIFTLHILIFSLFLYLFSLLFLK